MEMQDIIAIVTGGASGLGEATTRRIVSAGGKVAVFDMNEERGETLVQELGADQVLFLKTDVASAENVEQNVAEAVSVFGKVNAVVNCAGIATPGKVVSKGGPMILGPF